MSDANKYQVGGNHYQVKGLPQHWDLAIMFQWDPFQYQITKYVMRWKNKHPTFAERLTDLKKGLHFYQKYVENAEKYDPRFLEEAAAMTPTPPPQTTDQGLKFRDYEADRNVYLHDADYLCEGGWGNGTNLYRCNRCSMHFGAPGLEGAHKFHDSSCAKRSPLEPLEQAPSYPGGAGRPTGGPEHA